MRDIKVRAYSKEDEEMYYSNKTYWDIDFRFDENGNLKCYVNYTYADTFGDEYDNWLELDNIMESTGLKDRKSKMIYEGDIVKYRLDGHGNKIINLQVEYLTEEAGFYLTQNNKGRKIAVISMLNAHVLCEVIGDIYKNSDLLESV